MNKKGLVGKITLIITSVSIALLCSELILKAFYPQQLGVWNNLSDGMVIHPPNVSVNLKDFRHLVQFNSFGMRDREHTVAKEDGTFRVLLLGDSFMEALQVGFEESFPKLLEDRLRELTSREVEVINCAVSGWGTDDELAYLEQYGLKYHPDLILVAMTIHNDLSDNLREQFHVLVDGKLLAQPKQAMPWLEYRTQKIKEFLASHSHLTQLLRKYKHRETIINAAQSLDSHLLQLIQKNESAEIRRGWEVTYQLFSRIQKIGEGVEADTVVFLIPLAIQLYDDKFMGFLVASGVSRDDIVHEKPQQKMKEFATASGIQIIDLLPDFREWREKQQKSLHVADGHWNADGHRIAAEIVAESVVRKGLIGAQR